jgi:hypothetical protein
MIFTPGLAWIFLNYIQHCFICRPPDSSVSEDAGIEPRTVAALQLAFICFNLSTKFSSIIRVFMPVIHAAPVNSKEKLVPADIQRRDCILAWSVILSVHGADPIAEVKLLISPFLR